MTMVLIFLTRYSSVTPTVITVQEGRRQDEGEL
jgi:hypothetical protein